MEELGVEVGERPGHVGLGDRRQLREHVVGGDIGARARGERDLRLRGDAAEAPADRDDRLVEHRPLRGFEPEPVAQHAQRARVLLVVAEHRLDGEARSERDAFGIGHRLRALDHEPHDRLLVPVDHRQRQHARAQPHDRHERAHLQHVGEPPPHRPVGQLAGQMPARGRELDAPRRRAGLVDGQHPAAAPGRALGPQARGAQPPVEAVEQDPVLGARAADLEREALAEQRDRVGAVERRRQQQLDRRGRHAA